MVTSNHVHLLAVDDGDRDVIPNSMQLVAGRTGQEFNQRKGRKGAYWEDRYHATAVESGIDEYLGNGETSRQDEWSKSIAVGSQSFVDTVKALLGFRAKGRDFVEGGQGYQLREAAAGYKPLFEDENEDIALENGFFWDLCVRTGVERT